MKNPLNLNLTGKELKRGVGGKTNGLLSGRLWVHMMEGN